MPPLVRPVRHARFRFTRRHDAVRCAFRYPAALSAHAAESHSAVSACSTVIANSLTSIPPLVYRREGDNRAEAMTHPPRRITRIGGNDQMGWPDVLEHLVVSILLTGKPLQVVAARRDVAMMRA